jgi:hypothetical protein
VKRKVSIGVACCLGLAAAGTGAAEARRSCASGGSTIAADELVRLYTPKGQQDIWYVCDLKRDRSRYITSYEYGPEGRRPIEFHLAGRYVTWWAAECERVGPCSSYVFARDGTSTRPRRWAGPLAGGVFELQLNERGVAAYAEAHETGGTAVHVLTRKGDLVLADGADVDRESLALGSRRVYWIQGDQARSATV